MINWVLALETLDITDWDKNPGGSASYQDPKYGEIEFLWRANNKHVFLSWFDVDSICTCGHGFESIDCECEWIGFIERDSLEKRFTKKQYLNVKKTKM